MTEPTASGGPTLPALYALFPDTADQPSFDLLAAEAMPEPYRGLLAHTHHMTVTVEEFYRSLVDVRVLSRNRFGDLYARKILLVTQTTGTVVQFGIVRIDLSLCTNPVRAAIEAENTPLGRVLIDHEVLRCVQPTAYLRVRLGESLAGWFAVAEGMETFGRLGIIWCDHRPAIEMLEILAPITVH